MWSQLKCLIIYILLYWTWMIESFILNNVPTSIPYPTCIHTYTCFLIGVIFALFSSQIKYAHAQPWPEPISIVSLLIVNWAMIRDSHKDMYKLNLHILYKLWSKHTFLIHMEWMFTFSNLCVCTYVFLYLNSSISWFLWFGFYLTLTTFMNSNISLHSKVLQSSSSMLH